MATRTGAPYTSFEALYCDPEEGGCGVLEKAAKLAEDNAACPNCEHAPLSSVTVTTNDQFSAD